MSRRIQTLVVAFLIALVPLRASAWAMPCCESGEAGLVKALKAAQENMPCHELEAATEPGETCAFCAVHCVSGAQVLPSAIAAEFGAAHADQIGFTARFFAGVVLGQPERPPLRS